MVNELEKEVEKALVGAIRSMGGYCLKWVCPGWAGVPDRICLLPGGRVVFVELKRPTGGVLAERQKMWAKKLRRLGFRVELIKNREEVSQFALSLVSKEEAE